MDECFVVCHFDHLDYYLYENYYLVILMALRLVFFVIVEHFEFDFVAYLFIFLKYQQIV
jgi:hypothetical protein